MKIEIDRVDHGKIVLRMQGRIDADSSPELRDTLQTLIDDTVQLLVVDFAEVDFIDSSGLSALVAGHKSMRRYEGVLCLSRPHPQAVTALRLTLLDQILPVYPTLEAALKHPLPTR